jgi:hypothetical protein
MEWLSLIEKSFSMLYPNPVLPYLQMLYNPENDTFKEGFIWGNAWWIQNSYGFVLGAVPFLNKTWARVLQNSLDLFWSRIGDGVRLGSDDGKPKEHRVFNLVAPDGALGDCVFPGEGIIYKQGDGDFSSYDWFYEATAAALHAQADILLMRRDAALTEKYLPLLLRAAEFIEGARDRARVIATFLGILELTRLKLIRIVQETEAGDILIRPTERLGDESVEFRDDFR